MELVLLLENEWLKGFQLHVVGLYLQVVAVLELVFRNSHFEDRTDRDAAVVVVVAAAECHAGLDEWEEALRLNDRSNMVKEESENDDTQEDSEGPVDSNNRVEPGFPESNDAEDVEDDPAEEVRMAFERSNRTHQSSVVSRLLRLDLPYSHTFVPNLHLSSCRIPKTLSE